MIEKRLFDVQTIRWKKIFLIEIFQSKKKFLFDQTIFCDEKNFFHWKMFFDWKFFDRKKFIFDWNFFGVKNIFMQNIKDIYIKKKRTKSSVKHK